jgi:hypothetical protein
MATRSDDAHAAASAGGAGGSPAEATPVTTPAHQPSPATASASASAAGLARGATADEPGPSGGTSAPVGRTVGRRAAATGPARFVPSGTPPKPGTTPPGAGAHDPAGRTSAAGLSSREVRETGEVPAGGGAVDAAGMVVLACCAVWTLVCAAGREARPEGTLLALLAVTAGFAAGRVLGAMLPALTSAVGAVAVLALVIVPPHRLSDGPAAPPLGYHNADAALLVLAAGAACCAAWGVPGNLAGAVWWRVVLRLLAVAAAVTALVLGSAAGFAAGVATVLCSLSAGRMRHRRLGLAGLALAAALAVGGSCAVAVHALPGGLSDSLTGQLTQPRVALWHEAVTLTEHHPLRGVGPERFTEESTPLPSDTPTAQTPQSAPLQLAAEQGLPGVGLLGGAYLWTLCALWRSPRSSPVVLTAAAALTGLALLATVDHVLSYTVVTASAGLLAGLATSRPLPREGTPSFVATTEGGRTQQPEI